MTFEFRSPRIEESVGEDRYIHRYFKDADLAIAGTIAAFAQNLPPFVRVSFESPDRPPYTEECVSSALAYLALNSESRAEKVVRNALKQQF